MSYSHVKYIISDCMLISCSLCHTIINWLPCHGKTKKLKVIPLLGKCNVQTMDYLLLFCWLDKIKLQHETDSFHTIFSNLDAYDNVIGIRIHRCIVSWESKRFLLYAFTTLESWLTHIHRNNIAHIFILSLPSSTHPGRFII